MGFSSGLPLLLTGSLLQAWIKESGASLATLGLLALVGLPYTLKFLWAPLFDRFAPSHLGRRRGWLLWIQGALTAALATLAFSHPEFGLWPVSIAALLVSFFSASQDIVIDAYRRELLPDAELGLGSAFAVNGYRVGMLMASGGGFILADTWGFPAVYLLMALLMACGMGVTWLADEPAMQQAPPRTVLEAVWQPFQEYFSRPDPWLVLAFILLYKVGDSMAAQLTTPLYLELGFTKTEIGAIVKGFGFWATVTGGLIGGALMVRLGIRAGLWFFGMLQALSTLGFALLALLGPQLWALAAVIAFENLASGMGTSAYAAFMAYLTDRRFTATQYALLSSLMGVPRVVLAAPTGWLADHLGWPGFFTLCALIALPGLALLQVMHRRGVFAS